MFEVVEGAEWIRQYYYYCLPWTENELERTFSEKPARVKWASSTCGGHRVDYLEWRGDDEPDTSMWSEFDTDGRVTAWCDPKKKI